MRTRIAVAAALLVIAAACSSGTNTSTVHVTRSGSSFTTDGAISIFGLVRVEGTDPIGPVRLQVLFKDRDAKDLGTEEDFLPHCPPRTDCWWGTTFGVSQFDYGKDIRSAEVRPVSNAKRYLKESRVVPFDVAIRPDGRLFGLAPADEGWAYILGFSGGEPRWGTWLTTRPENRRHIFLAPSQIESFEKSEKIRAYFYPADVGLPE